MDTPDLSVGTIITYDKNKGGDLRLGITVRDVNLDDVLDIRARLLVLGETYDYVCPTTRIQATGQPERDQFDLIIEPSKLRQGVCTQVELFVSSDFYKTCDPPIDPKWFGEALDEDTRTRAIYWIWEMSGDPVQNGAAAQSILNSCQTQARAQATQMMPMGL